MSPKIKAVNIDTEEPKVEEVVEEPQPVEEVPVEEIKEEEVEPESIQEIIEEEAEKPKASRKMVTCPDCGKQMLEKNFRYQHINVCGKVKTPKIRAKPIEEVIKEKREKATSKPTELKPVEHIQPLPPPPAPDYWELRRQYNNQLKDRKTQLVKKLVSKAF